MVRGSTRASGAAHHEGDFALRLRSVRSSLKTIHRIVLFANANRSSPHRNQARITARGCRIHGHRLLQRKPSQIIRPARLRPRARKPRPAKRLRAYHRADHVAVDVAIAGIQPIHDFFDHRIDAGMDAEGEAVAERVDGVEEGVELT